MPNIVTPLVEGYIRNLVPERQGYLKEMEDYANEHGVPIIEPEVGELIKFLVCTVKPKKVLEIGTAIGYSTSIIANAMESGEVHTIELNEDTFNKAKVNIDRLGLNDRIKMYLGDGREVAEEIDEKFDIIFIDAAKGHYQKFFDLCFDKLNDGGVIISDNVLFKGMIAADEYVIRRKITIVKRMRKYLDYISNHDGLVTTVLPVGDGVALSYKKEK